MKKSLHILGILCLITGFISCDYISAPYPKDVDPNNGGDCPDVTFTKNPKPHRVVLLEDFTGHKCPNCPQGAEMAKTLQDQFKDSLVVVAIHASKNFSTVDSKYPEDFTTSAGDEYMTFFKINQWPIGMVNRDGYPSKPGKSVYSWGAEVSKQLKNPMEADIQIKSDYNASDSSTCISVQTTFQSASVADGEYYLVVYLIQDHIIAPQTNGTVKVDDYEHNHVLRDNITSTWGELISSGPVKLVPIVKKYKYKVKSTYKNIACNLQNCQLVAYIYDKNKDSYRVVQAAEAKLIE